MSRARELERGGKKTHKGARNELTPEGVVQGSDTASWYPQVFFLEFFLATVTISL
jgi:hypothetical protein